MFLEDLTPKEVAAIQKIGTRRSFAKGADVIEEGMAGSSFLWIVSGQVEVRKKLRGGKYKCLVKLGKCDLVGEVGFLGVECRTASVVALTDCEALEFDRAEFERFIARRTTIGMKAYRGMARQLAARLATMDEELMHVIVWALGQTKSRLPDKRVEIPRLPSLKVKTDSGFQRL